MKRAAILGAGQVSAAGTGIDALRRALAGEHPPAEWRPTYGPDSEQSPVLLAKPEGFEQLINPRVLRRLDAFSQRALAAAKLAWLDAGLEMGDPERVGVLIATGYGPQSTSFSFLNNIIDEGDGLGSPILFSGSVHNASASNISSSLGVRGPTLTVTGFARVWARALTLALQWLEEGAVDLLVLGSAEEYHEIVGYGLARLGGWGEGGRMRPLDFGKCTYVPGEGFTMMLLGREGERPARYGHLGEPRFFHGRTPDVLRDGSPLFIAAEGDQRCGRAYLDAVRGAGPVAAYSPLWGATPTSDAFTALAAAVSLRDGIFYPVPEADAAPLGVEVLKSGPAGGATQVHTIAVDPGGNGVAVTVSAP